MTGLGAAVLALLMTVVLFAPRRWALVGMAAAILYLPLGLSADVGGLNLYAVRFIELAGFVRVVARKEFDLSRLNKIDTAFLQLFVYTLSVFVLRSSEGWTFQLGVATDAVFSYFAFRGLIRDQEDLRWFLNGVALLLMPYASLVVVETVTSNNPFARVGGVELIRAGDAWFREGRLRATGSFGHPSLMGSVGAAFLALYVGLWLSGVHRSLAIIGGASCLAMVWASNSGGPAGSVLAAGIGWMLWGMRTRMKIVRRGLVAGLILLAIVMKAPIWYLIARFSNIAGGDGYHRSALIDAAFRHLDQWWLAGMRPEETATWLPYTNNLTGAADMTNHFLVFGTTAGLGSMILLIVVLTQGFRHVGRALVISRSRPEHGRELEYLGWALGVALGVHIFSWLGIGYWDQSNLVWFLHLAIVSSVTENIIQARSSLPMPAAVPESRQIPYRARSSGLGTSLAVSRSEHLGQTRPESGLVAKPSKAEYRDLSNRPRRVTGPTARRSV